MGRVFDINGSEFLVIAVIAVILVGPERLPEYVRGLRALVNRARGALREGETALRAEFGDDVDWKSLDPRQYDPRSIVRDALSEDDAKPAAGTDSAAAAATGPVGTVGTAAVGSWRDRQSASAAAAAAASASEGQDTAQIVSTASFDNEAT